MLAQARAFLLAVLVLAVVTAVLAPRDALAAPGFTRSCAQALAKQEVERLVDDMRTIAQDSPCELVRVDTSMFQTLIEWRRGQRRFELLLAPRGCLREASREGVALAHYAPPELAEQCPGAQAGIDAFVGEPVAAAAVGKGEGAGEDADTAELPALVPLVRQGSPPLLRNRGDGDGDGVLSGEGEWPLRVAALAWIALLIGAGGALLEHRASASASASADPQRRVQLAGLALIFAFALILRASIPATLANWYGPFLPPEGVGELRFGPSGALLQLGARALVPWSEGVAFGLVRIVGALAPVLVMLIVHRLGARPSAALVAGIGLACAPIAVRLSASSSEHVLAGSLALVAWAAWLRAAREPGWSSRVVTFAALLLAVLARVDCWPQLLAIGLWPLLAPLGGKRVQTETETETETTGEGPWLPLRRRLFDAAAFALCWGAIGLFAYFQLVLPSNHPGPELAGMQAAARVLVSQLWTASVTPPHWISPVGLGAAALGLAWWLFQRRFGLVLAAALSWGLVFVPLGRNLTHDGLTGARYFILALPLLTLLAAGLGQGVGERLESWTRAKPEARESWRRPLAAGLLALLTALELVAALPGLRHQYTFQAEYALLAEALAGRELAGCTLHFVSPRQPTGEPDLDCCLAPDRSPLQLVAPELRFRATTLRAEADAPAGCHLYYLGSLCALEPEFFPRSPRALTAIASQCEALRARTDAQTLVVDELTAQTLSERFGAPPTVELRAVGLQPPE